MTLSAACREFLLHCRYEKNLSPKTIKAYATDLRQFRAFAGSRRPLDKVGKTEIRAFLTKLSHLKPKSVRRKVATLKAMFALMEFEDRILLNPFRKMRIRIKEPKKLPSVLDIQEITRIFRTSYHRRHGIANRSGYAYRAEIRNFAVLELLFATGARVSEIANIRRENFNLLTGHLTLRGKGDKERVIHICNKETLYALKEYHTLFEQQMSPSGGWFFVNRMGHKLSDQSIRNLVKQTAREAGLTRRVTPHVFRHSFATLLLEKDVDIKYIQSLLGHSSIVTTQIYTHVNAAKQKRILELKHPRRDFRMTLREANEG
jgi:integrase/recombinase XerD